MRDASEILRNAEGLGGKYFAKFVSRVFEFFGEWALKTKITLIKKFFNFNIQIWYN